MERKFPNPALYEKPIDAGHFVKNTARTSFDCGQAASITPADVPFSEEIFTRLGDTYRRIRNTLRILLGNLYDFL